MIAISQLNTKKNILVLLAIISSIALHAQIFFGNNAEIGIDEKLGQTIPLNLRFVNEHKDTITLGELIKQPTVLSFVYFDCPGLCSPLQQGISEVIDQSDLVIGKDYKAITISFNYRDDPKKAGKKKKNFAEAISKNKSANWYYLTSDSVNINAILKAVGYKIKATGMDFAHPSGIVVVSPSGKITRYLYGLKFLPFDFKMAIIEAQKGQSRPTINKALDFCFSYDKDEKRYSLQVTKLAATIILFFAACLLLVLFLKSRKDKKNNNS
jgi:protein SCO1/2